MATDKTISRNLSVFLISNDNFPILLALVFLLFGFIGIINHEMWLDEVQAWLIARDSSSVLDLFKKLRYEGHPGLWHLCLYLITRFTQNPFFMQVLHLAISTSSIYIFAKFAPFTKLQKFLFAFGYFPFYEYSIISRNYAIAILLTFCLCALFKTRNKSYILFSLILLLIANSNIYGLIIATCFYSTLAFDFILYKRNSARARKLELIISSAIVLFGIGISIFQMLPPSDGSFAAAWLTEFKPEHLRRVILTVVESYLPIPNFFSYNFWNVSIFIIHRAARILGLLLSAFLILFSVRIFFRKAVVLFLYITGTCGILLFTYVKYLGSMRHWGHLFILFIVCLWISSYYPKPENFTPYRKKIVNCRYTINKTNGLSDKYKKAIIAAILYINFSIGVFAYTMDLHYPFSASKEVAEFVKEQQLNNVVVEDVKYVNYIAPPLSAYLNKKVFYLGSRTSSYGSYIAWDNKRPKEDNQKFGVFLNKLQMFAMARNADTLLVSQHKIDACKLGDENTPKEIEQLEFANDCWKSTQLSIVQVAEFTKSIIPDEKPGFYLYLIKKKLNH